MPTIHIFGSVLPKSMQVTAPGMERAVWPAIAGLACDFTISIEKGEINMLCATSRLDPGDFNEIYHRAYHSCRATVDLIAFGVGCGLFVHLHTVVWTDGKTWPIQTIRKELPPLVTAYTQDRDSMAQMKALLGQNPNLLIVLNDLIDSLNTPNHTPTHCARAIEGIRHYITDSEPDRRKAWKLMGETLQLRKEYVDYVTNLSQGPRHGDPTIVNADHNMEVGLRSWTIMNRFFEYLKRGRKPLPLAEFSLL